MSNALDILFKIAKEILIMKGFLGFHKSDELEASVALKAVRWAWIYTVMFLVVWCVAAYIATQDFPFLPFLLLVTQNIVFLAAQQIYARKMGLSAKTDNENQ